MIYRIWNDNDPNDFFEVDAPTAEEAAFTALEQLGWVVGEGYEEDDELDEEIED